MSKSTNLPQVPLPKVDEGDHGDWRYWERQWNKLTKSSDAALYTEGRPDTIMQFYQRGYFEDLWQMMGERAANSRYLELGSGRGTTSMYLAARGCDVTMVDIAPSAFELAKENFRAFEIAEPDFVASDVRDTGLPSESWDCIYNIGLLEHFEDPVPIIKEAYRLLKPNGLLFMVVVPSLPDGTGMSLKMTFNPLGTIYRVLRRRVVTTLNRPSRKRTQNVIRTDYSRRQYLEWAKEFTWDVDCCYYNPYHRLYKSRWLEKRVNVPIYRWHYTRRRKEGFNPAFQANKDLAQCYLLTATKPLL